MRKPVLCLLLLWCAALPVATQQPKPESLRPYTPIPQAPNCNIFPPDNVWNKDISNLPLDPNSASIINQIGAGIGVHPDFGSFAGYGIPYNVVSNATPTYSVSFQYASESDPGPYPIPANYLQEGNDPASCNNGTGGDCHVLLVNQDTCTLYELYALAANGNAFSAGSGAIWDLNSNALRPDGWTSADAAGLPILPGLVRYSEVAAGLIDHAFRFTVPHTRNAHIYPARHDAGSSSYLPPMGMRVRLRASFDTTVLTPQAKVIADALKKYGMLLADNGSAWYISGASDPSFDDDDLHNLNQIHGSDFEVVDTTGFVNGPNPDFSLVLNSTLLGPVFPGQSGTATGSLSALNGYSASINLSCGAGAPQPCMFVPASAAPPANFTLTAPTAPATAAQDYLFTVNAVGSDAAQITHIQNVTLRVVDYSLASPNPSSLSVAQGNPTQPITISVSALGNFTGSVSLSCPNLPTGSSCIFSPSPIVYPVVASPASVALVITTGSLPLGLNNITISASSPGALAPKTQNLALTITSSASSADLSASISHTTIDPLMVGGQTTFQATLTDVSSSAAVSGTLTITFSAPVSFTLPGGCAANAGTIICGPVNLSSGQPPQTFNITLNAPFVPLLTATATASSAVPDSDPSNNIASDSIPVRPRPLARH